MQKLSNLCFPYSNHDLYTHAHIVKFIFIQKTEFWKNMPCLPINMMNIWKKFIFIEGKIEK